MDLESTIRDVAEALRVEHLTPDDDGRYTLRIDDKFDVSISPLGRSRVLLLAVVGSAPSDEAAAQQCLERVLTRGLLHFREDSRTVISIAPGAQDIQLHRTEELDGLARGGFQLALEDFINAAEGWIDHLVEPDNTHGLPGPMHLLMP